MCRNDKQVEKGGVMLDGKVKLASKKAGRVARPASGITISRSGGRRDAVKARLPCLSLTDRTALVSI